MDTRMGEDEVKEGFEWEKKINGGKNTNGGKRPRSLPVATKLMIELFCLLSSLSQWEMDGNERKEMNGRVDVWMGRSLSEV